MLIRHNELCAYIKGESSMLEHQPYDHALKSLMGDRAAEIIPEFLPFTIVY
jgi:hypothetical protein